MTAGARSSRASRPGSSEPRMHRARTFPATAERVTASEFAERPANDSDDRREQRSRLSCSVVVPAFEAAEYLPRCIEGLLAAGFARGEIICVDDGSSDGSREVLDRLGIAPLVLDGNYGAAHARNEGARKSTADILFFVDSDVVVHADTRKRIERFFADEPGYAAIFGCYDADPVGGSPVNRFRNLLHRHVHRKSAGDAVTFWSGCGAIRRDAFERVGGFDPSQRMMEDVLLGLELHAKGEKIRLDPAIEGRHLKRWTLGSMFWTDMVNRAIPWTRLLRTPLGKASLGRLNLNLAGRLSGISVGGTLLGLVLAMLSPATGLAMVGASLLMLAIVNRDFLASMRRRFGIFEAVLALPLLWVHYLSACLGFAWATIRP